MANCWLEGNGRRFALRDGMNIIGRNPHAEVKLDSPMVARGHARVELRDGEAVLMDHHAINGTFIGDVRLKPGERKPLSDGDHIRIADVSLVFHKTDEKIPMA